MNTRRIVAALTRYLSYAALAGLLVATWTSLAAARNTLSAGNVSGSPFQTAAVPITLTLASGTDVAFFAVTFTVVPQGDAPPITDQLTYQPAPGVAAPDLQSALQAQAKLAIGYGGVTITPPLTGTVQIGILMVPIPGGATGSYVVQPLKISAGDSSNRPVIVTEQAGIIAVGGQGGSASGAPVAGGPAAAPPAVEGGAVGGTSQPAPAPGAARAPGGMPLKAGAPSQPTAAEIAATEPSPQPTEAAPAAVTPGQVSAPTSVATHAATAPAPAGTPGEQLTAGVAAPTPPKPAAATAAPKRPSPTVKRAAPAQAAAPPEKTGGCHCQLDRPTNSSGALLLIPLIALLRLRRRHRGSGRSI